MHFELVHLLRCAASAAQRANRSHSQWLVLNYPPARRGGFRVTPDIEGNRRFPQQVGRIISPCSMAPAPPGIIAPASLRRWLEQQKPPATQFRASPVIAAQCTHTKIRASPSVPWAAIPAACPMNSANSAGFETQRVWLPPLPAPAPRRVEPEEGKIRSLRDESGFRCSKVEPPASQASASRERNPA